MKASSIKINEIETASEAYDIIEEIENDYLNVVGGMKAWDSGYETYLTKSAENKIAAIYRMVDKKWPSDEE